MAGKDAQNIVTTVGKSRNVSFARYLYALGIRGVGAATAENLAVAFGRLELLEDASLDSDVLQRLPDIGPVVAEHIAAFFRQDHNKEVISQLLDVGRLRLQESEPMASAGEQPLSGKTFVVTGTLSSMTRDAAKDRIRDPG